jgi:hypothetical protein
MSFSRVGPNQTIERGQFRVAKSVVTEFEIHGAKECAIVGMRRGEQQAYLAAIDRCAAVFRDTV